MNKLKDLRLPIKESYLLIIIIIGIISLCMYSSFALFSLEKTSKNDIVTMSAASDIQTNLSIYEYQEVKVAAGESTTLTINVTNDTGGSIYYGVFYEMLSPSTKTDDITIAKIDWSKNATSGSITNGSKLPVELVIVNNSSSEISLNIGVAGSDSNELGLSNGKELIIDTFSTGKVISGETSSGPVVTDYSYTGAVQTVALTAGTYKLEVWGAQGGEGSYDYLSALGGKGGYSYGTLTLTASTNAYIYVGGQGQHGLQNSTGSAVQGGFNGGGNSGYNGTSNNNNGGGSGGGASDIRLGSDTLYSRVIVAGGGGGGGNSWSSSAATGGAGGGENGLDGSSGGTSGASAGSNTWGSPGGKGSQTSGGVAGSYGGYTGTAGSFGQGGNGYTGNKNSAGGGGGGGWYGGGPGSQGNTAGSGGGGGGSGYVYTSSTASNYPSGVKLNSSYYLTDAATVAGNTSFTDNSGSTVTGHSGNGFVRITKSGPSIPSIDTTATSVKPGTDLKNLVTCEDAGNGCKILFTKPSNTTNLTSENTYTVTYVLGDNSGNRYTYRKSVEITNYLRGNAVNAVINADDGTTGDKVSGVYKVHHDAIAAANSATGQVIDATDDYRYYGKSPNNYVCLDISGSTKCPTKHLYRMIGVEYNALIKKQVIKVIGNYITGTVNSSTNTQSARAAQNNVMYFNWYMGTTSTNQWSQKTNSTTVSTGANQIVELLTSSVTGATNVSFYNGKTTYSLNFSSGGLSSDAKKMVTGTRYYLGGYPKGTSAPYGYGLYGDTLYNLERGRMRVSTSYPPGWQGIVGLMYPSDLAYASGMKCSYSASANLIKGSSSTSATEAVLRSACSTKNWLSGGNEWLMMPVSNATDYMYSIGAGSSSNYVNYYSMDASLSTTALRIRPVMSLNPNVKITGGLGTSSSPYILSLE